MRYNKQDLPKIVVLFIVLIGLVTYIGISYAKLAAKYRKQEAEHVAAHARQAAASGAATTPGSPQLSPSIAALMAPVSPPDRDPFLPVISAPRAGYSAPVKPARRSGQPSTPEPLVLPPLTPTVPGQQPPFQTTRDANALALTGIIVGTPSLAVMRRGQDHFIVQVGSELPGKVRVQAVTRNSVTLKDGNRQYTLRLGQ